MPFEIPPLVATPVSGQDDDPSVDGVSSIVRKATVAMPGGRC